MRVRTCTALLALKPGMMYPSQRAYSTLRRELSVRLSAAAAAAALSICRPPGPWPAERRSRRRSCIKYLAVATASYTMW